MHSWSRISYYFSFTTYNSRSALAAARRKTANFVQTKLCTKRGFLVPVKRHLMTCEMRRNACSTSCMLKCSWNRRIRKGPTAQSSWYFVSLQLLKIIYNSLPFSYLARSSTLVVYIFTWSEFLVEPFIMLCVCGRAYIYRHTLGFPRSLHEDFLVWSMQSQCLCIF
jgi:hypothetical protein